MATNWNWMERAERRGDIRHIYKTGNRIHGKQRCTGQSIYLGYFERRTWDGLTSWSWTTASYRTLNNAENRWVSAELGVMNEGVK